MKNLYFLVFAFVFSVVSYSQEALVNGNFETWTSPTAPTGWTTATNVNQETTIIHGGTYSAKHAVTATSYLVQKITGLVPGANFTLSLWYKASGDGSDARIWSKWGNNGTLDSTTDAAILQGPNNSYFPNGTSDWTQYTVNLTVPATANEFNFEVRTYNGGTVYWDDFSFFKTGASSCGLALGDSSATCDNVTTGVDTYSATVAFTGGGSETYSVVSSSGTVGGDNPSTMAAGTITISGINEGTDITVDVTSANCTLAKSISSPLCVPVGTLPLYEPFNNVVGTNLGGQGSWVNLNTGDEILTASGNLSYTGLLAPTGESVAFDADGKDPKLIFTPVTSGDVFASFIFKVTDQTAMTDLTDGGYFAALSQSDTAYDIRLWVRPNPTAAGSTYDIGFGPEISSPPVTSSTYNVGDNVFVVMSYNTTDGTYNAWINPISTSLGLTAPTPTFTGTDTSLAPSIDRFILRQDSAGETPFIVLDELRIGTTWVSVTPADTAGFNDNQINGFSIYPNPAKNVLNIFTQDNLTKNVHIFDVLGKQVVSKVVVGRSLELNLPVGIYVVKVEEAGKIATQKLVVQ